MHALAHGYDGVVGANGRNDQVPDDLLVRVGGPRFGLIVSKAVGNAVIRHRVARRLRHMCAQVVDELPPGTDVVIRALPGAATASSEDLLRQVRTALRKLGLAAETGVSTGGRA